MKAKIDYTHKRGLPGGPNEQFTYVTGIFSVDGYRDDSADVNNPFNVIPSGRISMREHDGTPLKKGTILGIDNLGNKKMMQPGKEYEFPGDYVTEIPQMQFGGMSRRKVDKILNENKDLNFVQRLYQENTPSIMIPGQTSPSTHFMESADGKVYPTVVQMPDGTLQYLGDKAYNYAMETGEYIQFPNDRQATRFGKSYKKGTGVLQEFIEGGPLEQYPGGGDLRKGIEKGSLYASGFYTDPLTGSYVPSANIGFQTAMIGRKPKSGWTLGAQVGLPYRQFDENSIDESISYNSMLPDVFGKVPITAGIKASFLGNLNNYSGQGKALIDMKADYNPHSGFGTSVTAGPQFHFGRPSYSRGELRPGKAYGTITPFGGFALNTRPALEEGEIKNTSGITYGIKAEAEWKPELFKKVPISIYGKGMFSASPGFGKKDEVIGDVDVFTSDGIQTIQADSTNSLSARPGFSGEIGIRVPIQKLPNRPHIQIPNLSPLKSQSARENVDIEIPQVEGDINGGGSSIELGRRVNATTLEGEDIYVGTKKIRLPEQISIEIPQEEKQEGGELDLYKKYINGEFDGTPEELEAKKIYDKLNRVYYRPAKEAGMSVPNYIMSNVLTL